jgi:HEAT repeats
VNENAGKPSGGFIDKLIGGRGNIPSATESHLRNDIYAFTQKQHIAACIFSLDEVVIEPRVLTPLIQAPRAIELAPTDSVSLSVPYIPDWPELAVVYKASTMTLTEALQGGGNVVLAGHPGSGKTVALAWLAAALARNDKGLGKLAGLLPLYVHATDLRLLSDHSMTKKVNNDIAGEETSNPPSQQREVRLKGGTDAFEILLKAIEGCVTAQTLTRLPRIMQSALDNQRAILIVDRLDELTPDHAHLVAEYFGLLQIKYPKLRIIAASSFEDMAGLPSMGFGVLAMAAWDEEARGRLVQCWSEQWVKNITPAERGTAKKINPNFLKSWLSSTNAQLKPLEFTLKVWAAFSGDILGPDGPNAIEAYIRRMTHHQADARPGLERFAVQLLVEMDYASNPHDTSRLKSAYKALMAAESAEPAEGEKTEQPVLAKIPTFKDIPGVDSLASSGFLASYPNSRFGFSHPIIGGYLAGKALAEFNLLNHLRSQPSWSGKNLALYYLARFGDVTPEIQFYLQEDDLLHTNHLLIARWLQAAPKNKPWRTIVLRTLASVLMKERETLSLAAKIMTALAFSGDEGIAIYFRQLLKSEHANLKLLSALGCGILADKKAIADLNQMLEEGSPASTRSASLALAAIGDNQSLELLASYLLSGSELLRRSAAEALANNPKEGHPSLKDGSAMEDVLVRRSVIFGLIRIDQPWATKIVENLQLEDKEWVVRNAAIQVFDELHRKINLAPQPLPDLTETTWLAGYANRIGTRIAPGKPAEELVAKALVNGNPDEKLNAMDYFRDKCDPGTIDLIYTAYKNSTGELHDAAYYVLWLMTAAGIKLPFPFE